MNIIQYLQDSDIKYKETGKNIGHGWIGIQECPVCEDRNFHLGVHKVKGFFSCWVCGVKGNIVKLVKLLEDSSYRDATERVKSYMPPEDFSNFSKSIEEIFKIKKNYEMQTYNQPSKITFPPYSLPLSDAPSHYPQIPTYLHSRGFEKGDWEKWEGVYYCYRGYYQMRIIFPLTIVGKPVNYSARAITEGGKRYLNCPNETALIPMKDCIFNYDKLYEGSVAVVHEGIFDVLKFEKLKKYITPIALLGKELSGGQKLLLLNKKLAGVYIMLDRDAWAQTIKMTYELADLLSCPVTPVFLDNVKDPAELNSKEELQNVLFCET